MHLPEESFQERSFLHGQVEEAGIERVLVLHELGLCKLYKDHMIRSHDIT